jgi:hypothetical protein
MAINVSALKGKQIMVLGAKGCGKTYFTKWLCKHFPRHLVFDMVSEYKGFNRYLPSSFDAESLREELELLLSKVVIPKHSMLDMFIVEEADMILPNKSNLTNAQRTLLNLNRHFGITTVFITRRPALINTNVFALSNYIAVFKLIEKRDIERISYLFPQMKDAFAKLDQRKHNFIFFDGNAYSIEKI